VNTEFAESDQLGDIVTQCFIAPPRVLMVMPYIDHSIAERCALLLTSRAGVEGLLLCVHDKDREGFNAIVNRVYRATQSQYFGYVAQDAYPGRKWLALALNKLQSAGGGLFAFNDGKWMGALAGFGVASRDWAGANYEGDFFCPGYKSHYADTELTVLALNDRRYCYDPNSVLVEVDWGKDTSPVDINDKALYQQRKQGGFDKRVDSPVLLSMFG
jgi:hypothetical protein